MAKKSHSASQVQAPCIMVCVTRQKTCERLICHGAALADGSTRLEVVHAVKTDALFLGNESEGEALEYLFAVSRQYGADMTLLRTEDVLLALVNHAREQNAVMVVLGEPAATDIATQMRLHLPGVEIIAVQSEI